VVGDLELALVAFACHKTPARMANMIADEGRAGLARDWDALADSLKENLADQASRLRADGVGVVLLGDRDYPESLLRAGRTVAPVIFFWGNRDLLGATGVGMCGSRAVSDLGLRAARACGEEVSARGLVVISGYAKGVDTETHLAALRGGGRTVIVLAEGMNHFRIKKTFAADFDPARVLVLSQFPPSQPWGAYAAMARNHIIFGMGKALVVIEAGERGGTLAAGQEALKAHKPVLVLDFGDETPAGNKILLATGGTAVGGRPELMDALDAVTAPRSEVSAAAEQLTL
jgi:DNA processing protein